MKKQISRELMKGVTPLLLLSLLREGKTYGYQMVQCIKSRTGGVFVPCEGSLYPMLDRMHREGWVEYSWEPGPTGRPRKYCQITEEGRLELARRRKEWKGFVGLIEKAAGL